MEMGDLISRKAMLEAIDELRPTLKSIREFVRNRPAVDAEPVRHGRWVWDGNGMDWNIGAWVCSECGMRNENILAGDSIHTNPYVYAGTIYCPNCGARMDGGRKED